MLHLMSLLINTLLFQTEVIWSLVTYIIFSLQNMIPVNTLKKGGTQSGSFSANHFIDKFAFINPNLFLSNNNIVKYNPRSINKNTLYIVDVSDLPQNRNLENKFFQKVNLLETIRFINNQNAIYIFTSKSS